MARYNDALRGYAHEILERDGFVCRYCELDGKEWPNWLYLSEDHLLPHGHPMRDNQNFIVACCRFCNELCNRTQWEVGNKNPEELVAQKKTCIQTKRREYKDFWDAHVRGAG